MDSAKDRFRETSGEVTMRALTAPLASLMSALDSFLEDELAHFEPELREMVRYSFAHSGKRLRPILVFFGGWGCAEASRDGLVRAAAIVEMVHLATLVHDDILDGATLRHGMPTLVAGNGAHAAVLLGDAMFSEALRLAALFPTTEVCRVVALATRRVCAGEVGQTFQRGNDTLSLDTYYRVIELKTAELFRASCYLGAHVGGLGDDFARATDSFGLHLGTAYQIFDDLADLLGDEHSIGKTLGTDLASGKYTLPVLLLLKGLDAPARADLEDRLAHMDGARLRELLEERHIVSGVREAFDFQVDEALRAIEPFRALPACEPLTALADFVRSLAARM